MSYLISVFVVLSLSLDISFGQSSTPQELADSYKSFHTRKDLEKTVALFYSKDASPVAVASIREILGSEFESGVIIEKVVVEKINQEALQKMTNGYPYQGKLLGPTIKNLTHTMKLIFVVDDPNVSDLSAEIYFGETDSGYMFTLSKLIAPN